MEANDLRLKELVQEGRPRGGREEFMIPASFAVSLYGALEDVAKFSP